MLKQEFFAAFVLTVAMASAGTVPKAIKARYKELEGTMKKWDAKAFKSNFSPDFVVVDPKGGDQKLDEFMDEVSGMMTGVTKVGTKLSLKGATVEKDGTTGVQFDFKFTLHKAKGSRGGHEVGTDYWKKEGGKWVIVKTVDTEFTVTEGKAKTKAKGTKHKKH